MFDVAEIMSTELLTLGPDASLQDARALMAEHGIRHIPIVEDENRLVGLLSQRDVLAAADSILLGMNGESEAFESRVAVSTIMTMDPKTTDEQASLRGAALYLQQHRCLTHILIVIRNRTFFEPGQAIRRSLIMTR